MVSFYHIGGDSVKLTAGDPSGLRFTGTPAGPVTQDAPMQTRLVDSPAP
jgi:hypothetical protein